MRQIRLYSNVILAFGREKESNERNCGKSYEMETADSGFFFVCNVIRFNLRLMECIYKEKSQNR